MRNATLFIAFLLNLFTLKIEAQTSADEKITLAVLPFVASTGVSQANADAVQATVTKEFISKPRFTTVDRSKFEAVIKELNIQKSEEFLNSKIVEQGKLAGAQYLVTGVVSEAKMNAINKTVPVDYNKPLGAQRTVTYSQGSVKLAYQVIDVTTGTAMYQENINVTGSESASANEAEALSNALCVLKSSVKNAILKEFPPEIQVVQVEKTDKKGLPDKVLISAGSNMFDEAKNSGCATIDLTSIFKKKGVQMKMYQVDILNINGKESKREKEIGILRLDDVQGDVSVCDVVHGAKEVQTELAAGKKILVKVL